ncbi:ATP synthase F0 subunit C [Aeoliella mucimassa]|uniref:ATP synthase subunit c n=1 Tax=Aeoliella mucimassa TaxID=2527972 RepID=A0A518ANS4_9BACT|nr:ATP synthase F0 subunit C [Aeoliella mucimassa]QDU56376.1 ATP synthase subunit c [Aeoliella mucimassa]
MAKTLRMMMLLAMLGLVAAPAFAQGDGEETETTTLTEETTDAETPVVEEEVAAEGLMLNKLGAGIGAGIVLLGVGFGIGRIGGQAVEGMSRQPEVAGNIQTAMIIAAALIEGAGFFALVVCLLA